MAAPGNHIQRRIGMPLVLSGIAIIGCAIWFVWLAAGTHKDGGEEPFTNGVTSGFTSGSRIGGEDGPGQTTAGKRPRRGSGDGDGGDVPQFPLLDQVLSDGGLSNEQAAARLLEIVVNPVLSLLEREEALAHGLDLDLARFLEIVADPQLPQQLAQRFFDEMLNCNDKRDLQVRACMALMDHQDTTMREDATRQLAFYIGLEEWVQKPDVLRQEAYSFLEEWAKRPKPQPEPVDPSADLLETAPFTQPQPDEEEAVQE